MQRGQHAKLVRGCPNCASTGESSFLAVSVESGVSADFRVAGAVKRCLPRVRMTGFGLARLSPSFMGNYVSSNLHPVLREICRGPSRLGRNYSGVMTFAQSAQGWGLLPRLRSLHSDRGSHYFVPRARLRRFFSVYYTRSVRRSLSADAIALVSLRATFRAACVIADGATKIAPTTENPCAIRLQIKMPVRINPSGIFIISRCRKASFSVVLLSELRLSNSSRRSSG